MMVRSERKTGTVTRKGKNALWVEVDAGCETSESKCTGGCAGCSGGVKSRRALISGIDPQKYPVGRKIEFQHFYMNENLVAFVVFGIPVTAAFLTIVAWYIISPETVETPKSFLSAAVALIAGFFIVNGIDSWFRSRFPSKIISELSSEVKVSQ
jgi:hypothetical protein